MIIASPNVQPLPNCRRFLTIAALFKRVINSPLFPTFPREFCFLGNNKPCPIIFTTDAPWLAKRKKEQRVKRINRECVPN